MGSDYICNSQNINCNKAPIKPFSKYVISKWKNNNSTSAVIPTNSRPIPQFRHTNNYCKSNLLNTNEITPKINENIINSNDFITHHDIPIQINSKGMIVCNDDIDNNNKISYYNGPGWKTSRVHPNIKTTLSRPIKHWRRQLFPRQFANQSIDTISNTINESNLGRCRSNISSDLLSRPGSINITNKVLIHQTSIPIYINDNSSKLLNSCKKLNNINAKDGRDNNDCVQSKFLSKIRPGTNQIKNPWDFRSNKSYLQGRVRLSYQNNIFSYNNDLTKSLNESPCYSNNVKRQICNNNILNEHEINLPSTVSLYLSNKKSNNCNCAIPVSYKPSNMKFQKDSAVDAKSNIRRKSKISINKNQYNITNSWGINSKNDSLYTKYNNSKIILK